MLLYEQHFPASAISAAAAVHPAPVLSQAAHPAPNPFSSHIPAAATAPCFVSVSYTHLDVIRVMKKSENSVMNIM